MGDTHEIRLPDGRSMAYSDLGAGPAVLACHGTPGTRLEGQAAAGLRVLTPDRPGFGRSSPQPGRTLADWPADAAVLLDALGLDRVGVIGGSGGGPYAIATGVALGDRVTAVALLAPGIPVDAPVHGSVVPRDRAELRERGELFARLLRDDPGGFNRVTGHDWDPDTLASLTEAFRQGADAYVEDHSINDSDWAALLPQLKRPARVWHGAEDDNIPVEAVRWMVERMPDAELTVLPDTGHDVFAAWPDAFGWLAGGLS
ncbi:MAG TPA: alpha/beta hydrolase [Mycobacteriales bacterium]|nr:alpha/beta hydrolase [Mycobacteriales bacterium]